MVSLEQTQTNDFSNFVYHEVQYRDDMLQAFDFMVWHHVFVRGIFTHNAQLRAQSACSPECREQEFYIKLVYSTPSHRYRDACWARGLWLYTMLSSGLAHLITFSQVSRVKRWSCAAPEGGVVPQVSQVHPEGCLRICGRLGAATPHWVAGAALWIF